MMNPMHTREIGNEKSHRGTGGCAGYRCWSCGSGKQFEPGPFNSLHAASGWQTNRHALRLSQQLGFAYSSDTRGTQPFIPTWRAEIIACPQLPTTLPTLDELMNRDGINLENIAQHILGLTAAPSVAGHVFTLHAEIEGGRWLPVFEQLLQGWQAQGYELVSLRQHLQNLEAGSLPRQEVVMRDVDGCVGRLAVAEAG